MTSSLKTLAVASLLSALTLLAGCSGGGDDVIARVGDYDVTMTEFQDFLDRNPLAYRTADEEFEGKRALLDSTINHTLLIEAGYEKGIQNSPEVAQILNANRDRFLLDALYEYHVGRPSEVTEAEIRDTYADLEYQINTLHIVVDNEDTAQMLFDSIMAGGNFEQLAYEYSLDPTAKRTRGDMGYYVRGTAPDVFERVAFKVEVGEITPPFQTRFGWHIVKMVDKKLNEAREEFARMRPTIKKELTQQKRDLQTRIYFDSVRVKYQVSVDTAVADYITHKRETLYPPQVVAQLPAYDFDDDQLDRDEKELILAKWNGGEMTLIEYLMTVRRLFAPEQRPALNDYDALALTIYAMKRSDILVSEALAQKMDESEHFLRGMKMFERYTVAEIMKNDSIPVPGPPTEQDMRDYYDQNREEFLMPAQVHLFEILVSDELLAQRLARDIKGLNDFQARAVQFTERASMKAKRGDLGFIDQKRIPELFNAAKQVPVGTVGGPIRFRGKYSVIWPVQWTEEAYLDFLTVKEDILKQTTKRARDQAILDWMAERRKNTDIEVYEERIWETIDKDYYAASGSGASQS
jgi:foldase protein PrsA